MVMEGVTKGAKVFVYLFHFWYSNPIAIFSLRLLAHAYHLEFQLVRKFSSMNVTVFLLTYMDRLLFSNYDSNQEVTGEQ